MQHVRATGAITIVLAIALSACGDGGSDATGVPTKVADVVDITMTDNAYSLKALSAKVGDEVTYRFTNEGSVEHEAIIGTSAQQDDHETEMTPTDGSGQSGGMGDMAGMEGMDEGVASIVVPPGESKELTYRSTTAGDLIIGCHVPGHYAGGMRASLSVS